MGDRGQEGGGSTPSSRDRSGVEIFICDASAEAGRLLTGLQSKGYAIVDVPLGLLPSRVLYEVPHLVICDADAREARRHLAEMLKNASGKVKILLLGHEDGALKQDPKLVKLARDALTRPVDIAYAMERITQLAGPPSRDNHHHRVGRSGRAPILVASARKPYRSDTDSVAPFGRSLDPADEERLRLTSPVPRAAHSELPRLTDEQRASLRGSSVPSNGPPSSERLQLSEETEAVLEEGRKRVAATPYQTARPSRLPTSGQDTGGEIRAAFIEALLEPLDLGASDPDDGAERPTGSGTERPPGHRSSSLPARLGPEELTNPGGRPDANAKGHELENPSSQSRVPSEAPALLDDLSDLLQRTSPGIHLGGTVTVDSIFGNDTPGPGYKHLLDTVPPPLRKARRENASTDTGLKHAIVQPDPVEADNSKTEPPPPPTSRAGILLPQVENPPVRKSRESESWVPIRAIEGLARAVRERRSGAIAQQEGTGIRRTVFVDGDISTVTSSIQDESLAHFLLSRGDFPEEVLDTLGALPKFGRHAGAALIARGLLAQDDLWPILRAHAEWILGRSILSKALTHLEAQVPGRVSEEPAVFGGAAGTEIYIDSVRRVISPRNALALLGGSEQVLSFGPNNSLMGESALDQEEQDQAMEMVGQPLAPLLQNRPELLPVLLGLCHLKILSTGGVEARADGELPSLQQRDQELDDEAFVARVKTRRALIEDGDYFSILGISRSATIYEIDRAREELLGEYADERLNARTVHLLEDLAILRRTIDEAHLVLSDEVRRRRYRTALEALPV